MLIFTSYRDSVNVINEKLNEIGVRSEILIGKSGETGRIGYGYVLHR